MHTPKTVKTIQEITRNQYNLLVHGQKLFYDTLIADGKIKIVNELTTEEKSVQTTTNRSQPHLQYPKTSMKQQYQQKPDLISQLINSNITVLLNNGNTITGILQDVSNYELIVNNTIIMKHAITTIQLASDSEKSNQ